MIRVFVVEDSIAMQSTLIDLIHELKGFEVVATAAGEMAATEWVLDSNNHWDLAVVDLILADGSGFGVLRRCKSVRPASRAIIFSGFADGAMRGRCIALGADAVFTKTQADKLIEYLEQLPGREGQ